MLEKINNLSNVSDKTIDMMSDVYTDTLKPSAQETGKLLAVIPRAIRAALFPLSEWILRKEYNLATTEELLAQKLKYVSEDKIVSPEPYVAIPAIQAISYSMNSDELRNLYANLLSKAMNIDTKDKVHPSFVEIIKQLSPADALVFKTIMCRDANPIVNLMLKNKEGDSHLLITNISDIDIFPTETVCVSIDNLQRQGLIDIPDSTHYTNDNLYSKILASPYYREQQVKFTAQDSEFTPTPQKLIINKTSLGKAFYNICVNDL